MAASIAPPDAPGLLAPFLPALPAAAVSTEPAIAVLPLLSPILRQRVQLLSPSSTEPWLRLLCYDISKAAKLSETVQNGSLEPHPVSGEVEVDWDYDAETRFRRLDEETIQALVVLAELGLAFQLVYCVNDAEGGGDGWRVGEVTIADKSSPFAQFGGAATVAQAEQQFTDGQTRKTTPSINVAAPDTNGVAAEQDEDEDDGYWDRYDATPARTPARTPNLKTPPVPASLGADVEDDYYAQYDDVQPAMDNHDPDEEMPEQHAPPPLGLGAATNGHITDKPEVSLDDVRAATTAGLLHPRPESSASSNGSHTVARLEATAGKQEQNEFGVKQHVSRSIRSLYMLAKASGIDRAEFEQLVQTELDVLGMLED